MIQEIPKKLIKLTVSISHNKMKKWAMGRKRIKKTKTNIEASDPINSVKS